MPDRLDGHAAWCSSGAMFAEPYNWCDTRCERCPLRARCELALMEGEWTAAGGPDDLGSTIALVAQTLAGVAAQLAAELGDDAIDLELPPSRDADRLETLGLHYGAALGRLARLAPLHADPGAVADLSHYGLLIARKCGRLALSLREIEHHDFDELFAHDGAPNVLLLEVVGTRLPAILEALFEPEHLAAFAAVHAELARLLAPLAARVPDAARAELAQRIERGDAPSPFAAHSATGG